MRDLATFWFVTRPGSIFRASDSPPRMANDSATQPAPRIRWRTHCRVVSAASRTNSTSETLDRTCVQWVTVCIPSPLRRRCRQGLQRTVSGLPTRTCQVLAELRRRSVLLRSG